MEEKDYFNYKPRLTHYIPIKVQDVGYSDKFLIVKENSGLYNKFTLNNTISLPKEITILNDMKQKTQTISRADLKKIYDVACPFWKNKIKYYATRNLFGDVIHLHEPEIKEMFDASDPNQKNVLKRFFNNPLSIYDKVKSFADACKLLNIKEDSIHKRDRILIIIKALNEGWKPDWTNHNEYKYWNYFQYDKNGVFSFSACYTYTSNTALVPSALYLKNRDLAAHAVKIGFEEYKDHYYFSIDDHINIFKK